MTEYKAKSTTPLQFLAIGHFTHDVTERGLILGGAASYSSMAAKSLGLRAGVVSSVGKDFLHFGKFEGISLTLVETPDGNSTTTFQNIYEMGARRQILKSVSAPIHPEHIPSDYLNTDIVYLCPVADEVHTSIARMFPSSIVGVSPQGWMRQWDNQGRVSQRKWKYAADVLPYVDALIMSEEDISSFPEVVYEYMNLAKVMVITRGEKGSTLFHNGQIIDFPAFPVHATDPTGAGDVFAVAFLIEYNRTHDLHKASVFANCAASFVVEKQGTEGIPNMDQVLYRLKTYQHRK